LPDLISGAILPAMPAPRSDSIAKQICKNLFAILENYQKATGKTLSTCSREFYGKSSFFANLRKGEQSLSLQTLDELLNRIRKAWPPEADWPFLPTIRMNRRRSDN
jgi:hypothetical protein